MIGIDGAIVSYSSLGVWSVVSRYCLCLEAGVKYHEEISWAASHNLSLAVVLSNRVSETEEGAAYQRF